VADTFPSFQSRTVTIDGVNLHYLCGGTGPPLVLVHGLGSSASVEFHYNLEALAAHHRVFAIDLPGFGRSDKPVLAYTIDLFVRAVSDLMTSEGVERAAVMGVSMGGRVALGLALDSPEKVERLVLVDALGIGAPRRVLAYSILLTRGLGELTLRGTARALRQMNPAVIRRFWGWYLKRPNRVDAIWSDERIANHGTLLATLHCRDAAASRWRRDRRPAPRAAHANAADLGRPRPHLSRTARTGSQGADSQRTPRNLRRQRSHAADGGTGAVQSAGSRLPQ
jgi:pimeloyl-ACP methyl ester carboxylesterase